MSFWAILAQAAEPVRMAFQEHFPPFVEVKDGKPTGLAVDIVRAAATKAGIDVDFVPV
ncbi:MAG: transporter substrate-binding domain-containing protein, partial [Xanthobacteraceae bacterium]|nr:transporter substrate-binding domain-containing protein [Xanthobacteraceae bacterium]